MGSVNCDSAIVVLQEIVEKQAGTDDLGLEFVGFRLSALFDNFEVDQA